MKLSFIISLIIIILAFNLYLFVLRNKKNIKANIFLSFVTCILSISVLVFPLLKYNNLYLNAFASFIYAMRCAGMGQDLSVLSTLNLDTKIGYSYFVLMNILFVITPLLTVSFIIAYLERMMAQIRFAFSKNKKLYIFSDINEKSLLLAKSLEKVKRSTIIFANVKDKTNIDIKSIKLSTKITNIKFNPKSDITFYMISDNEEQNLNETLELIDKYKNRDNTKIYVINKNEETPTILDSTNKGKITVEIVNEKERAIFSLLNSKPLFLNSINNTISILIVGCGNIGKEFLRDSIWCSMIPGFKLKVLVVDVNADKIKENINAEMPELLSNYDVTFLNEDIKSKKAMDVIKSRNDVNYIMVSMDNDDKNIDTAILLRRLYLREFDRKPIININIENEHKEEQVSKLSNEKGYSYDLNAFGSINDIYNKNRIIDSKLEKLATQIHLSYDPEDKDLHRYNLREYNKRASRACALHIKYKLYSVLKDKYTDDMSVNQELFRKEYNAKIERLLVENEHDRWNAYMRSVGYINASINDVKKYYNETNHYIHYLARKHPALVDFNKLDEVSEGLSKIAGKKIDLEESDRKIIKCLYKSIDL